MCRTRSASCPGRSAARSATGASSPANVPGRARWSSRPALGGVTGAALLLVLPASAFARIVPVLILIACGLVAVQPRLSAWVLDRRARLGHAPRHGGGPAARHRGLPDRHLRRLLRGSPGGHPDRPPVDPHRRRPAATQRPQERARDRGQRGRRDHLHRASRRSPGRSRSCSRSARRSAVRSARRSAGDCRPRVLRGTIIVVGTVVAVRLLLSDPEGAPAGYFVWMQPAWS